MTDWQKLEKIENIILQFFTLSKEHYGLTQQEFLVLKAEEMMFYLLEIKKILDIK